MHLGFKTALSALSAAVLKYLSLFIRPTFAILASRTLPSLLNLTLISVAKFPTSLAPDGIFQHFSKCLLTASTSLIDKFIPSFVGVTFSSVLFFSLSFFFLSLKCFFTWSIVFKTICNLFGLFFNYFNLTIFFFFISTTSFVSSIASVVSGILD